MPTPSEKEAIELLVNFLLNEFSAAESIDLVINNVLHITREIKLEYTNPTPGFLGGFYIWRNSGHEKKLDDLLTQINDLNPIDNACKGLVVLQYVSDFFSKSEHWQQGVPQMLQQTLPAILMAPLQRHVLPDSISLKASINFRILSAIIDNSKASDKDKEIMNNGMERLCNHDVAQLFFAELNNGISHRIDDIQAANSNQSIGDEVLFSLENSSDHGAGEACESRSSLSRVNSSNSINRGLYKIN